MKYRMIAVACLVLSAGCAGLSDEEIVQTAVAETAAAATDTPVPTDTPTPTDTPEPTETPIPSPTPYPLLDSILIPSGMEVGNISERLRSGDAPDEALLGIVQAADVRATTEDNNVLVHIEMAMYEDEDSAIAAWESWEPFLNTETTVVESQVFDNGRRLITKSDSIQASGYMIGIGQFILQQCRVVYSMRYTIMVVGSATPEVLPENMTESFGGTLGRLDRFACD